MRRLFLFLSFVCFTALLCACADSAVPRVDAGTAAAYLSEGVREIPRHSGSPGAEKTAEWIRTEAAKNPAARVSVMEFRDETPAGEILFRNVVAEIPGASSDFVIVGAHYDAKYFPPEVSFAAANDGASGVAALLAMIRAMEGVRPPLGIRFVFFDGEEAREEYGPADGLHGSRHAARVWAEDGSLKRCRAMILLDMIGDRELGVAVPADTPAFLVRAMREAAKDLDKSAFFSVSGTRMLDDHVPFQERGVPSIDLIDFHYGPGNSYWHTAEDSLDKVSPESVRTAADVAFGMIWRIAGSKETPKL